ncbi:MAG TPA: DUF3300 domain-containing protein [Burkholderiales bacterium]|nr:DUF3300 domain-containing protein [Burkholderiales bacterium]
MKTGHRFLLTQALVLPLCMSVAFAQTQGSDPQTIELGPAPGAQPAEAIAPDQANAQPQPAHQDFSQQELDQMLAPIALYPDTLLSQILMASTYPIEIVQAARWSKANPGITGDAAVKAVEGQSWDPSVKSLTAFPNILSMMDEQLDWMERLGDAFLAQEQQVMATVQTLRQKAQAAGNLQSNENVRVEPQGQTIVIEQANPQVVYVPYYDPTVIYGPWWYPAYPPVFWRPWPGYYARPGWAPGFFWGSGVTVSAGFFFGRVDWPRRNVTVVNVNNYYYHASPPRPRPNFPPGAWVHDPAHRRGVPYRDPVVRQEFARAHDGRPDMRRDFRGNPPGNPPRVMGPQARPAQGRPEFNRPGPEPATERVQGADRPQPQARDRAERQDRPQGNRPEPHDVPRPNAGPVTNAPNPGNVVRTPPQSNAGVVNNAPNAGNVPRSPSPPRPNVAESAPRPVQQPPSPPRVTQTRPAPEPRPHVFDGVGQGPVVRDSSQRGRSSKQAIPVAPAARVQPSAPHPAPHPAPAPRPSGGGRGEGHGGNDRQH